MWLLRKLPSIPHFPAVRTLISSALRGACVVENNPDLIRAYIAYLSIHTRNDELVDLFYLAGEICQVVVERHHLVEAILPPNDTSFRGKQTIHAFMAIFCNYLQKARNCREQSTSTFGWSDNQDLIFVQWPTGEQCTIHILVIHCLLILLTYYPENDDPLFEETLNMWFPETIEQPKFFMVDTNEEATFIPDWLKLRMIRSNIPRLLEAALKDLEPQQLVLFIQSFGLPVSVMSRLLQTLDNEVRVNTNAVSEAVLDKSYMAQLVEILHKRGATGGNIFKQVLQLMVTTSPPGDSLRVGKILETLPPSATMRKQSVIQSVVKDDVTALINKLFVETPLEDQVNAYRMLCKMLAKDMQTSSRESRAVQMAIDHIRGIVSSVQVEEFLTFLDLKPHYSCTLMKLILLPLKKPSASKDLVEKARKMCFQLIPKIRNPTAPILAILQDFANLHVSRTPSKKELISLTQNRDMGSILDNTEPLQLEIVGRRMLDIFMKKEMNDVLVEGMAKLLVSDCIEGEVKPRTGLLIDWLASVEPELIGICPHLQMKPLFGKTKTQIRIDDSVVSSHSCRPYLLTLLTHRASWETLYKCVEHLLNECHNG